MKSFVFVLISSFKYILSNAPFPPLMIFQAELTAFTPPLRNHTFCHLRLKPGSLSCAYLAHGRIITSQSVK